MHQALYHLDIAPAMPSRLPRTNDRENSTVDLLSERARERERERFPSVWIHFGENIGLYNKSRMISFVIGNRLKRIIGKETLEGKWITKN